VLRTLSNSSGLRPPAAGQAPVRRPLAGQVARRRQRRTPQGPRSRPHPLWPSSRPLGTARIWLLLQNTCATGSMRAQTRASRPDAS